MSEGVRNQETWDAIRENPHPAVEGKSVPRNLFSRNPEVDGTERRSGHHCPRWQRQGYGAEERGKGHRKGTSAAGLNRGKTGEKRKHNQNQELLIRAIGKEV